jgi:hypothetical protein
LGVGLERIRSSSTLFSVAFFWILLYQIIPRPAHNTRFDPKTGRGLDV